MRYFFLIFGFFLTIAGIFTHSVPTYNLTVERSRANFASGGFYHVTTDTAKNIWYIGIKNQVQGDDMCVEWDFGSEKKTECIDHDGTSSDEIFSFPVIADATSSVDFRIQGGSTLRAEDIVVYSMDTRSTGSRWTLAFPRVIAEDGIVSRSQWGADETMRYADSPYWKDKYPIYLQYVQNPKTQNQLDAIHLDDERLDYLIKNGGKTTETTALTRTENGHPLIWPIQKVRQISRIVIHHTAQSMDSTKSDAELIRGIYTYHTLSREWGDIGYNYLVGQRGVIYEGRAGGDYVVGSHASYNNMGTVGISVLGDYNRDHLNRDQIAGVETAIMMMARKYGITLSENKSGVRKCINIPCDIFEVVTTKSLLGHQDIGHTDCPGVDIYQHIPDWISRLDRPYAPVYNPIQGTIEPQLSDLVMNMTLKGKTASTLSNTVIHSMSTASLVVTPTVSSATIPLVRYVGQKFRVKLSYPDKQNIILATADGNIGKLMLDTKRIPLKASKKIQVSIDGNSQLTIKVGKKTYKGGVLKFSHSVVRIDSWNRLPDWDKLGKYNDNLFRDTIRVLNKDGELTVINDLPIEWYLKGMGEVSNTDPVEKIKTIIVSARSYATWYMNPKNRKFSTNLFDGSDNPDEFQKYLGYSYELRSPNVARLVDLTRRQVITYSGSLIKPWYHSSSDGRTLSAMEYCQKNGLANCVDIPYLQSVSDPASEGKVRSGHGVGISGIGATYWAQTGWNYQKIIQYYLHGVEIQRK